MRRGLCWVLMGSVCLVIAGLVWWKTHSVQSGGVATQHVKRAIHSTVSSTHGHPQSVTHVEPGKIGGTNTSPLREPPAPAWAKLPPSIRLIAGQQGDKDYLARVAATHHLGKNLQPEEVEALCWFLHTRHTNQGDLDSLAFNAIKNDVLDALIAQEHPRDNLGFMIIEMYKDKTMDETWRNYCVQRLAMYYKRKWNSGDTLHP